MSDKLQLQQQRTKKVPSLSLISFSFFNFSQGHRPSLSPSLDVRTIYGLVLSAAAAATAYFTFNETATHGFYLT